jgi:hypothetical protein
MLGRFTAVGAVAGVAVLLFSAPASALVVNPGPYTASSTNLVIAGISCPSATIAGVSSDLPTPTISITSLSASGCVSPVSSFSYTVTATLPWTFTVSGPTSGSPGSTPGTISGITLKLTSTLCTLIADGPGGSNSQTGTVNAYYGNSGFLVLISATNLKLMQVSGLGCLLEGYKKGDSAPMTGTFYITSSPVPEIYY